MNSTIRIFFSKIRNNYTIRYQKLYLSNISANFKSTANAGIEELDCPQIKTRKVDEYFKYSDKLKKYNDFNEYIISYKDAAKRSFIVQDLSPNLVLWHRKDSEIKTKMFPDLPDGSVNILRWKLLGRNRKCFLLFEFSDHQLYRDTIEQWKTVYEINFFQKVGFFSRPTIDSWKKEHESRLRKRDYTIINLPGMKNLMEICSENSTTLHNDQIYYQNFPSNEGDNNNKQAKKSKIAKEFVLTRIQRLLEDEELLSELQLKLRFFIIVQIEHLIHKGISQRSKSHKLGKKQADLKKLMENLELVPYGSQVSGMATPESDIDLAFIYRDTFNVNTSEDSCKVNDSSIIPILQSVSINLELMVKYFPNAQSKGHNIMGHYYTHYYNILRLFRAYIPIIKCNSRLMPDVNIDISVDFTKSSGVQMAQYLFYCNYHCDLRVRVFIILLKYWGKYWDIIRFPNRETFTSFMMTALGVAFLQSIKLVPTLKQWRAHCEDGTSIMLNKYEYPPSMKDIHNLMKRFFEFVINFDHESYAIDLNDGNLEVVKPEFRHSPLHIINPILPDQNITNLLCQKEYTIFREKCQNCLNEMKGSEDLRNIFK